MKPVKRLANNNYKITSDLEGKLLEEMKDYDVELYSKKRALINCLKEYKIFTPVATYTDGADTFKLSVISDQDDELCPVGSKQLKLVVYSLFNISDHRQNFIEQVKMETQANKNLITLIPDSTEFLQIDKLLGEISRYTYIEQKYSNETDQSKRQIIRDFSIIREEKEKHLRLHIENAYKNAALIYMFDQYLLNADTFKGTINDVQKKQIKNIYTKRLTNQLSETLVPKVFSARKEDLTRLFTGNEFKFFDTHGNFTGEHLKVIEEINAKISTRAVDGRSLEADLSGDPWGYSFGTIVTTLAALLRAGRLTVRHNAESFFSHDSKAVHEAFTNATKFKAASFKSITATLSSADKTKAVQLLMDLEVDNHIVSRTPKGEIERIVIVNKKQKSETQNIVLPTTHQGNHYMVTAAISGDGSLWENMEMVVDTGADIVVLPESMIAKLGMTLAKFTTQSMQTANGMTNAKLGVLHSLKLAGETIENVQVAFIADKLLGNNRLLGMSALNKYQINIDDQLQLITLIKK